MSGRGSRGGCGVGQGRGRGRGKTRLWQYTPGAEVYEQLWRVRKEPAIVTARLPNDCPVPYARTRILYRRQTEDAIKRERYAVEIRYARRAEDGHGSLARTEVADVDLVRIMQFVSPAELERYETEQFRLEAEAEAIAIRTEAEDLARLQLRKNAKESNTGRGSRILSGLSLPVAFPTRARGRPRGSRGRGSRRSGGLMFSSRRLEDEMREELLDSEPNTTIRRTEHTRQSTQTSPSVSRSAFFANSALPTSLLPRSLSTSLPRQNPTGPSYAKDAADLALANASDNALSQGTAPPSADQSSPTSSNSDDTLPAQLPQRHREPNEPAHNTIRTHPPPSDRDSPKHDSTDEDADSAEEYVVESIVEHFQEDGKTYYLVKWGEYEDSHDWLPEEDLEGAPDLVAEYKARVGGKRQKVGRMG